MKNETVNIAYDQYASEYDQWFDKHANFFQSELLALMKAVPQNELGIEIGVGSGRFAHQLNIQYGVEPSEGMGELARKKGIKVIRAVAEDLPIDNQTYDFVIMVTTVCFLSDIQKAFSEVTRILKPQGAFIIGLIDRNSELGKKYEQEKAANKFYKDAHFHSTDELSQLLSESGFGGFSYWQTLIHPSENQIEQPQEGYGRGSFVVVKAQKNQSINTNGDTDEC